MSRAARRVRNARESEVETVLDAMCTLLEPWDPTSAAMMLMTVFSYVISRDGADPDEIIVRVTDLLDKLAAAHAQARQ